MDSLDKYGKDNCDMALRIFEKTNSHKSVSECMDVSSNVACKMVLASLHHKKLKLQG
jgi:hypothetical protein